MKRWHKEGPDRDAGDGLKFDVLVNRQSGAVLRAGEDGVRAALRSIFGDRAGDIRMIAGAEIAPSVRAWLARRDEGGERRGLIIGGGDGSLLTAVTETLGREDVTLGVLPLGTQNFLSRELGFSTDYKEAARQYLHTTSRAVDVGEVNGMPFLYGVLTDPHCVHFFRGREAQRRGDIGGFLGHIFACVAGTLAGAAQALRVRTDSAPDRLMKGHIFVVSTNLFAPRPSDGRNLLDVFALAGNAFAKKGESEGKLALYAVTAGVFNVMSVIRHLWSGTWHRNRAVRMMESPHLVIRPQDEREDRTAIILDGEIRETSYPLDVRIRPAAVRLYRPAPLSPAP